MAHVVSEEPYEASLHKIDINEERLCQEPIQWISDQFTSERINDALIIHVPATIIRAKIKRHKNRKWLNEDANEQDWLSPKHFDRLALFVYTIIERQLLPTNRDKAYVNISYHTFEILFSPARAPLMKAMLLGIGVIESDGQYITRFDAQIKKTTPKAIGYRLNLDLWGKLESYRVTAPRTATDYKRKVYDSNRIPKLYFKNANVEQTEEDYITDEKSELLTANLCHFYIDMQGAIQFLKHFNFKNAQSKFTTRMAIQSLGMDVHTVTRDHQGRCYSPYTSLKKEFRRFIRCKTSSSLSSVDLKQLQPTMLLALYEDSDPEIQKYQQILSDDIYIAMIKIIERKDICRDTMKTRLLSHVINAKAHHEDNPTFKAFSTLFPSLTQQMQRIKSGHCWFLSNRLPFLKDISERLCFPNNANLGKILMRIESHGVIDCTAPLIRDKGIPFFTIHDCIVCPTEHAQFVNDILIHQFELSTGITCRTEIKQV